MLNSIVFINLFSIIVCLIIFLLNKLISNNEVTIKINNNRSLMVKSEEKLIDILEVNEILIPKTCGGKGTCGSCKVIVISGGGNILPAEEAVLKENEIINKIRLSCQVMVKEDLHVYIPQRYINNKRIILIKDSQEVLNDQTFILTFKKSNNELFIPGSYIQLSKGAGKRLETRNYTIYPSSKGDDFKEIRFVPQKESKTDNYLITLKEHNQIDAYGPYREFAITPSSNKIIWIVNESSFSTLPIIIDYLNSNNSNKVEIYHLINNSDSNLNHNHIKKLENKYSNLTYNYLFEQIDKNIASYNGSLLELLDKKIIPKDTADAYLSGSPKVIDSVTNLLNKKEVNIEKIWYDSY